MIRPILITALLPVLLTACAAVGVATQPTKEYVIDQVVDLPENGIAPVSFRVGPIEVIEVRVRNMPTAKDIAEDTRKTDHSRPKPVVTARNHGTELAMVNLAAVLEDANGVALFSCERIKAQELFPGMSDDWNTCFLESMRTADWPRVKRFHVRLKARVRETAPAAVPAAGRAE